MQQNTLKQKSYVDVCGSKIKVTYSKSSSPIGIVAGVCGIKHKTTYSVELVRPLFKKQIMKSFELETKIAGQNVMTYMASLIEKNEKQEIEIERGKLSVAVLKQMNNRSRLLLDSAKYELKAKEFELEKIKQSKSES